MVVGNQFVHSRRAKLVIASSKLLTELGRCQYQPSGIVDWKLVRPRIALTFLSGVAIAIGLWTTYFIGHYYIVINACIAALLGLRMARWIVVTSHCRNPKIAMILALPIGLLAYIGFWQAQLIELGGWQMFYRFDLLPAVIWHSWTTQQFVFEKVGGTFEYQFVGNVIVFWVECLLVIAMPVAGAQQAANQVYSEENHCWANARAILVSPEVIPEFNQAIRANGLVAMFAHLKRLNVPNPKKPPPRCVIVLNDTDGEIATGYLSIQYLAMFSRRIIFQLQLTPQELAACRKMFAAA
jgi:hypothetical protein